MSNVYVINESGHNYSLAREVAGHDAEIIPLTSGQVDTRDTDRILFDVARIIREATADDWLLLSGPPAIAFVVAAVWLHLHKVAKMLAWDAKAKKYLPRSINTAQIEIVADGGHYQQVRWDRDKIQAGDKVEITKRSDVSILSNEGWVKTDRVADDADPSDG